MASYTRPAPFFHYVLASELVPAHVAGLIAGERERRTISDLLVTRLSSAEIVLGKLTAGLAQFATTFAIGVPALVLMPHLCGFDPTTIAPACVGMASTAFFVGGLSILVSTGCRRSGRAIAAALPPIEPRCLLSISHFPAPWEASAELI